MNQTESHELLYARQQDYVKELQADNLAKDVEIGHKNQQIRALTHKVITLQNNIHGLYEGSVTLTQALAAAEQSPMIEVI